MATKSTPRGSSRARGSRNAVDACVTGATGFVGAHVARAVDRGGGTVRVVYRDPDRLSRLAGVKFKRAQADVTDLADMRRAVRGAKVVFHTAGYVGSSPVDRVWDVNARSPRVAVEAAAAEGVPRVVVTSSVSALGPADGPPADEENPYPEEGLDLQYPDSKRRGDEEAISAGEGFGVEVVVVNPSYVLGVPVDRSQPGETSTRIVANYLLGRLPAVFDAPQNFVDVEDVAAGHLLAAEKGRPGERYILGGFNSGWVQLIDRVAAMSGVRHPVLTLPRAAAQVAALRARLGLPGLIDAEGYRLMAEEWRYSSEKAERALGYTARPFQETLARTVDWYQGLIEEDVFADRDASPMSIVSAAFDLGGRLGLTAGLHAAERLAGRRLVAGA